MEKAPELFENPQTCFRERLREAITRKDRNIALRIKQAGMPNFIFCYKSINKYKNEYYTSD